MRLLARLLAVVILLAFAESDEVVAARRKPTGDPASSAYVPRQNGRVDALASRNLIVSKLQGIGLGASWCT